MKGRFSRGLYVSLSENPKCDTMYVSLSDVVDAEVNELLIQTLRSRNYTDDQHKWLSYWELCKTAQGILLMYQGKKHKNLADAKSNLATFFKNIGIDPSLADGLQYLDFKGLLLFGLFSSIEKSTQNDSSLDEEVPEKYRPKDKPTWEDCKKLIEDVGGVATEQHKEWALATGVIKAEDFQLTKRRRISPRSQPSDASTLIQDQEYNDDDVDDDDIMSICHGAYHAFDGVLHMLKAKTSKMQGETEWKTILKERLENDYHGFARAVETASDLMNAGLLPQVSRELNPDNKKSLMIHRVRAVCNEILAPYVNEDDPNCQNRFMTDKEFKIEVNQIKARLSGGQKYACSICGEVTETGYFWESATKLWIPISIPLTNITTFNIKELGKSQFIACGNTCEDILTQRPTCETCGVTEIVKSKDTYIDPRHSSGIPSLKTFFKEFEEFDTVSEETKQRRQTKGLTVDEIEELKAIHERPAVKELQAYMQQKPPRINDIECKKCGKGLRHGKIHDDDYAWRTCLSMP